MFLWKIIFSYADLVTQIMPLDTSKTELIEI